jgi:uncharacterized membrane protein YedE/YeeE
VINEVSSSLENIGTAQYLMAFLFLGSYAFALGGFVGERGRRYAAAGAATAALAFALLNDPWEQGVLVVAAALVALGLFVGAVWLLWSLLGWPHVNGTEPAPHGALEPDDHAPAPPSGWRGPRIVTFVAGWRRAAPALPCVESPHP